LKIDYRSNPRLARLHDVLDAETGEDLSHLAIVRADDAAGTLTTLAFDDEGEPLCDDLGRQTTVEVTRKIRITLKPECQGAFEIPRIQ
jgi:hypothetical protein